jgi:hypothetical protein
VGARVDKTYYLVAAQYLANPPRGEVIVYLVASVILFALAGGLGGWQRDPYKVLVAAGLGFLALALLTPT